MQVITTAGEVFHLHFGIGTGAPDGVADLLRLDHGRESLGRPGKSRRHRVRVA
jgi:hypothetical protein